MKEYELTAGQKENLSRALQKYNNAKDIARATYGSKYIEPILPLNQEEIENGRFKPGDRPEYQRLIRLLDGAKPEQFVQDESASYRFSKFDKRMARTIEKRSTTLEQHTINANKELLDYYNMQSKTDPTIEGRKRAIETAQLIKERMAESEATLKMKVSTATSRRQARSRLAAQHYRTSPGQQARSLERFKENYLHSLMRNGLAEIIESTESGTGAYVEVENDDNIEIDEKYLSDMVQGNVVSIPSDKVNSVYQRLASMSAEELFNMISLNPDLEIDFIYNSDDSIGALTRIDAALRAYEG